MCVVYREIIIVYCVRFSIHVLGLLWPYNANHTCPDACTPVRLPHQICLRTCEYDEDTLEYWVNIRTTGTLTKEDVESMQQQQTYSGEGGDDLSFTPKVALDGFAFSDDDDMIHTSSHDKEGDQHKSAPGTAYSCYG